ERLMLRRTANSEESSAPPPENPSFGEAGRRIRLEVDRKILFLDPDEIICCESDGNYCRIIIERCKSILLTNLLKSVGMLMGDHQFLLAHKSYIVNLKKIRESHRVGHYLLLSNDKHTPVSRQLRGYFMDR